MGHLRNQGSAGQWIPTGTPSGIEWLLTGLRDIESLIKLLILILLCSFLLYCSDSSLPFAGVLAQISYLYTHILSWILPLQVVGQLWRNSGSDKHTHPTSSKRFCFCFCFWLSLSLSPSYSCSSCSDPLHLLPELVLTGFLFFFF